MTTKKKKKFIPLDSHYETRDKSSAGLSISLYGQLEKDGEAKPSDLGISHPTDPTRPIYRSVVVGYSNGSQCTSLDEPQHVSLPFPDGPADGCGWDPKIYVVWKDAHLDWITLHKVETRKTLGAALSAGIRPRLAKLSFATPLDVAPPTPTWAVRITNVVMEWAEISVTPDPGSVLGVMYAQSGGSDWPTGAKDLSNLLLKRLEINISWDAIVQTWSIDQLIDALG